MRVRVVTVPSTPKLAAIDPTTGQTVPLFHPRRDNWHEHFTWNYDCTLLIGLTPTGRITVEELDLNREGVINLRQVMSLDGETSSRASLFFLMLIRI
ncbi:MAG: hypothetical protein WKF84_09135 [Pyrinomonadaceae bacterium]